MFVACAADVICVAVAAGLLIFVLPGLSDWRAG